MPESVDGTVHHNIIEAPSKQENNKQSDGARSSDQLIKKQAIKTRKGSNSQPDLLINHCAGTTSSPLPPDNQNVVSSGIKTRHSISICCSLKPVLK